MIKTTNNKNEFKSIPKVEIKTVWALRNKTVDHNYKVYYYNNSLNSLTQSSENIKRNINIKQNYLFSVKPLSMLNKKHTYNKKTQTIQKNQQIEQYTLNSPAQLKELELKWIKRLMLDGKKTKAEIIHNKVLSKIRSDSVLSKINDNPLAVFGNIVQKAIPYVETKPKRIGGTTIRIPKEIEPERQLSLAMRWLLLSAKARNAKSIVTSIYQELKAINSNQGATVSKRDEMHKLATANREFAHFRY